MLVDEAGVIYREDGDPNPTEPRFWIALSQVGPVEASAFAAQAHAAWDFQAALERIAGLPGPHYSETTKAAIRLAREALG